MEVFVVEYTNQECVGNQTQTMEIEAASLDDAWELVAREYPHLDVDHIFYAFAEDDDEWDGQPDEAQEWHDFDPDC